MGSDNGFNRFAKFDAGLFLRQLLQEGGRDMSWIAACTRVHVEILGCILAQRNMNAELFVRLGKPTEPLFLERMHETIFGK